MDQGRERSIEEREVLWLRQLRIRAGSDLPNHGTTRTAVHHGIMRNGVLAYPKIARSWSRRCALT